MISNWLESRGECRVLTSAMVRRFAFRSAAQTGGTARTCECERVVCVVQGRRYSSSMRADELARPKFVHDHASADVDSSLVLVDLEQRLVVTNLSQYFDTVRQGGNVAPLREASRKLLSGINEFLDDLQASHPMQGVEDRKSMRIRQKLLTWLEDAIGVPCASLTELREPPALARFRTSICESIGGALLSLVDALESDDPMSWDMVRQLTGDRGEMMRRFRVQHMEMDPPLQELELINVLLTTNSVEETFFQLSKVEEEFRPGPRLEDHAPHV